MIVHKISLDMQKSQRPVVLLAKQGDSRTRAVEIAMFDNSAPWAPPEDLTIKQVVFCKKDQHGGAYDTMPAAEYDATKQYAVGDYCSRVISEETKYYTCNTPIPDGGEAWNSAHWDEGGEPAVSIANNKATVKIAPEVLTCPGKAAVELQLLSEDGAQVATWTFFVDVKESVENSIKSRDYWGVQSIAQLRTALRALEASLAELQGEVAEGKTAVAELQENPVLKYVAFNIPMSGDVVVSLSALFPKSAIHIGDTVVGANGHIGVIEEVNGTRVTISGTGMSVGTQDKRTDVSAAYAAQGTYDTPEAYLASLPAGRYVLDDNGEKLLYAENDAPDEFQGTRPISRITSIEADGTVVHYIFADGTVQEKTMETRYGTVYTTPISVPTPTEQAHATPKEYVDSQRALLAANYSASQTYAVGDYCARSDKLWRCIVPIETPEAWTPTHWEEVTVGAELAKKLEGSGVYPELTAGKAQLAAQLEATVATEDRSAYSFRTAGGSLDIGDTLRLKKLVGGTVCWNQLLKAVNSTNWTRSASTATVVFNDGVATVTPNAQYVGLINVPANRPNIPQGHKVLAACQIKLSTAARDAVRFYVNEQSNFGSFAAATTAWQTVSSVGSWDASASGTFRVTEYRATDRDAWQVKTCILIDLTQLFGTEIAEHIYALEQATAGAGVAWFRRYFPKDYYAYDPGSLQSVRVSAHKTVGFNAYEEHVYPLDASLELRGLFGIDASGNLTADGDEYAPDGTVTRKYAVREYSPGDGDEDAPDMITDGMHTVYKVAQTTTESASAYAEVQSVDDFGTEEFVDAGIADGDRDVAVPVGHVTLYPPNLRAKLEMAPNAPAADGDYIVRKASGLNSYVPLPKELPALPSVDGTYTLKCTVTDGTATVSWVSDS